MTLNLKRCIFILLVLMLLIGIVPHAYAAEASETVAAATEPEETIDPTEPTEPTNPPNNLSTPTALSAANDYAVMSVASTQNSIMLFDYADNGNYTTVLNYQVSVSYKPNGTGSTKTAYIKNMGWHFARYGGVPYPDDPLYCIEPYRTYAASTSGNSVDRGVTMDGSGSTSGSNVWYALPAARREAIGLILLYSNQKWDHSISVTTTKKDSNPNVPLRIATQMLIYEIVCGLRDPVTFESNSTNECGTKGNIFYEVGVASVPYFAPNYNSLVDSIQAAKKIPSFTSASSSSAPTITLTGEETAVYDSNGVLPNFSFTDGNGAEFYKSGYDLYITQTGTISESTVFKATRSLPSAASSTYCLWYMTGSSYQTTISLENPSTGSLNAYFKLKGAPQTGNLSLTKTTEDGKNLSGWQFSIYSNSTCTNLVSGPHTTNSSGKISVTGLTAGTYYVKELGHTDSAINALYTCASTNPQQVTISAGATASVSFQNKLNTGGVKLVKKANTGNNLSGWQIGLYTDSACTSAVTGSPFTTGTDGTLVVSGLIPGTYYAKEVASSDPYWVCDTAVKTVTVATGQTTEVTFTNTHKGRGKIIKTMPDGGSVSGWVFEVYSSDNKLMGTCTTGEDGTILTDYLLPGEYTVKEIIPAGSPYICDAPNPKSITITPGQTAEVAFTNRLKPGEIMVEKVDTQGAPLSGAEFLLEWSSDGKEWKPVTYTEALDVQEGTCTSTGLADGRLTSGEDGIIRFTGLNPNSLYRLTETKAPNGYQLLTEPAFEGKIQVEDEYFVQLTVVNAPVYELPMTGASGSLLLKVSQIICAALLLSLIGYHVYQTEQKKYR